jgi:hypothetical protein
MLCIDDGLSDMIAGCVWGCGFAGFGDAVVRKLEVRMGSWREVRFDLMGQSEVGWVIWDDADECWTNTTVYIIFVVLFFFVN